MMLYTRILYNAEAQNGLGFLNIECGSRRGGLAGGEIRKTNILSELCDSVREAIILYTSAAYRVRW